MSCVRAITPPPLLLALVSPLGQSSVQCSCPGHSTGDAVGSKSTGVISVPSKAVRLLLAAIYGIVLIVVIRDLAGGDTSWALLVAWLPAMLAWVLGVSVVDSWNTARKANHRVLLWGGFESSAVVEAELADALAVVAEAGKGFKSVQVESTTTSFIVALHTARSSLSMGEEIRITGERRGAGTLVSVSSEPVFRRSIIDGGLNFGNVVALCHSISVRVPETDFGRPQSARRWPPRREAVAASGGDTHDL
jgi:hypothetical protein